MRDILILSAGAACGAAAFALVSRRRAAARGSRALAPTSAEVTADPIDHERVLAAVSDPGAGAVASFLGVTRDTFEGRRVRRLEYEGYAPMAEREMLRICEQARARWELKRVRIVHRVGVCPVGEASVVIAASAAHRREALEAVAWAIDTLKASVPIWKKEFYDDEGAAWKENKEWARGAAPAPGA